MSPALGSTPARAARRLTSPFRTFFNQHFAMVKDEVTTSRDRVLASSNDVQRTAERVAHAADKIDDSSAVLAARLGRVLEQQDALGRSIADLSTRAIASLDEMRVDASTSVTDHALWCAFVVQSLRDLDAGARVLVAADGSPLAGVLAALGFTVAGAGAGGPADAVAGHEAADVVACGRVTLRTGGRLLFWAPTADTDFGLGVAVTASVASAGGALVAGTLR